MTDDRIRKFMEKNPCPAIFEWHPLHEVFEDSKEKKKYTSEKGQAPSKTET
jgi:hypothetical protein